LHWFETLEEAKAIVEDWRQDYNENRPHSTLNDLSPAELVRRAGLPSPVPVNQGRKLTLGMALETQADQKNLQCAWRFFH
jgi:putative transposase